MWMWTWPKTHREAASFLLMAAGGELGFSCLVLKQKGEQLCEKRRSHRSQACLHCARTGGHPPSSHTQQAASPALQPLAHHSGLSKSS